MGSRSQLSTIDSQLPRRVRRRAFTLVELLVAAGITALLAGFIAGVVRNVSTVWARSSGRLGADAQARLVLDRLQLDLQGARYRDDGNVWLAVDVLNSSTGGATGLWQIAPRNPKPVGGSSLDMAATRVQLRADERGKLEHARFGTAGVWLRFFTTSRGSNTAATPASISAPVAVGYQIVRRFTATNPANRENIAYQLHRSEARPAASGARPGVLESGYNIAANPGPYTTGNATNTGATAGDPRSIQVPGTERTFDAVIAENVIDFGVRCYVRDAGATGGLRLIFPANSSGTLSNAPASRLRGSLPSSVSPARWGSAQPFPDVVDVMVRILTDEGAAAIANMERLQTPALPVPAKYNNNAQEWWWGAAQEHSRVYTRRIVLNARAL